MNFNNRRKSGEPNGSSDTLLEEEWQAFAGLVDDKLLMPSRRKRSSVPFRTSEGSKGRSPRKPSPDDCMKPGGLRRTARNESELQTIREKCSVQNRSDERRESIPRGSQRPCRKEEEDKGISEKKAERHREVDSNSCSSHLRRTRASRSSSSRSDSVEHYRRKTGRSRISDSLKEDQVQRRHRHHCSPAYNREAKDRHGSRHRRRSRSDEKRRSSRDRFESPKRHDDDGRTYRYHHRYQAKRRTRSRSVDRHKIQEETMQKLMKMANDGQLDLTKISLSEVMKTIVVPREYRHNQQHAMRYQMAQLTERIEQLTGVKIPSFYCTGAVNPLVYAEQMRKRKLLWSGKTPQSTSTAKVGIAMTEGKDEKTAEKFRKLLGIRDQSTILQQKPAESDDIIKRQNEAFQVLDREYELARLATHTHRGTGLGFLSAPATTTTTTTARQQQQNPSDETAGGGKFVHETTRGAGSSGQKEEQQQPRN